MGQHKHNPTALAAKNGELAPKPKKMSKRAFERWLMHEILSGNLAKPKEETNDERSV